MNNPIRRRGGLSWTMVLVAATPTPHALMIE